jgi:CDP-diacylglycerol pyrophosphatase
MRLYPIATGSIRIPVRRSAVPECEDRPVRRLTDVAARAALTATLAVVLAIAGQGVGHADPDPDALWRIVHTRCVPDQLRHGNPSPCARVEPGPRGSAVLKDLVGGNQFLLIPTARITGIESPALLQPGSANYFHAAWAAKSFVDERAGWVLPRDWVSLAINSTFARSQNQLHIHVDCIRDDVRTALGEHAADVGPTWTEFPEPLAGHRYDAIAVDGEDLAAVDPFVLLADGIAGARDDMAARTLVAVGAVRADGRPGFVVLAGHVDPATADLAEGEELQDHASCPPPPP